MKVSVRNYFPLRIALFLFAIAAPLLLLDRYTALSINNTVVLFILFYIAVTALPVAVVFYKFWNKSLDATLIIMLSTFSLCFVIAFLTWNSDWKTQTILYRNRNNQNQTIEFRMRADRFGFGYHRQIVSKQSIFPFIELVKEIDIAAIDTTVWQRTNERVNELHIPGEYIEVPPK